MHVHLLVAKPVREGGQRVPRRFRVLDQFCIEDVGVEGVAGVPVIDMDDDVV